jgi:hypothetical protein
MFFWLVFCEIRQQLTCSPVLVLDRRGVRYEHRSDQTPKFGDLLRARIGGRLKGTTK